MTTIRFLCAFAFSVFSMVGILFTSSGYALPMDEIQKSINYIKNHYGNNVNPSATWCEYVREVALDSPFPGFVADTNAVGTKYRSSEALIGRQIRSVMWQRDQDDSSYCYILKEFFWGGAYNLFVHRTNQNVHKNTPLIAKYADQPFAPELMAKYFVPARSSNIWGIPATGVKIAIDAIPAFLAELFSDKYFIDIASHPKYKEMGQQCIQNYRGKVWSLHTSYSLGDVVLSTWDSFESHSGEEGSAVCTMDSRYLRDAMRSCANRYGFEVNPGYYEVHIKAKAFKAFNKCINDYETEVRR